MSEENPQDDILCRPLQMQRKQYLVRTYGRQTDLNSYGKKRVDISAGLHQLCCR